jgi:hypothetical protein
MTSYRFSLWAVASSIIVLGLPLRAQVLDTFSSTSAADAVNYNAVEVYTSSGSGPATFAINGSGQFQPTSSAADTTTEFFRNDTVFNLGDTVSVDIDQLYNSAAVGLAFGTSPTSTTTFELDLTGSGPDGLSVNGGIANLQSSPSLTFNFSLGPVIETVTRTSNTVLTYSLSGLGLTSGPVTGTVAYSLPAGNLYFALSEYTGDYQDIDTTSPGKQIEDNLTYVAVPEPSIYAMMLVGVALLGFSLRRKSVLFQ